MSLRPCMAAHRGRRIGRSNTWLLISISFSLAVAIVVGCESANPATDGGAKSEDRDPPVAQPQGSGDVKIEVRNLDLEAALLRVDGNQISPIEEFQKSELVSATVESGFYLVRLADDRTSYPAPAHGSFINGKIQIKIVQEPEPEDGWSWIPPGPAIIGDTLGVGREDERPAVIFSLPAFFMGQNEITNREYAEFLSAVSKSGKEIPENWLDLRSRKCRVQMNNGGEFSSDAPTLPVVMVSLAGAMAYCDWLTETTGVTHRLPTEIEWEKAARGPESFVYSYGNIYKQSLANQESGKLKPVGSYEPNSFGLYDMTGNVIEWMSDKADPSNESTTLNHSLRGGSFVLDGMYLRNSFRMRQSPTVMTDDIGFRVVRECNNEKD